MSLLFKLRSEFWLGFYHHLGNLFRNSLWYVHVNIQRNFNCSLIKFLADIKSFHKLLRKKILMEQPILIQFWLVRRLVRIKIKHQRNVYKFFFIILNSNVIDYIFLAKHHRIFVTTARSFIFLISFITITFHILSWKTYFRPGSQEIG